MKMKVVSLTMTVYCLCEAHMTVTGTPDGIRIAVREWAKDHRGEGHKPMTASEFHKLQREKKRAEKLAVKQAERLVNEQPTEQMALL